MGVHEHNIARAEGNGAGDEIDDLYDGEEYQTKDQRAETRTTFYERDIDQHCASERQARQLKRALRLHEGEHTNHGTPRSRQNREEYKRRVVGVTSSQMGMTKAQKARVEHLVLDVIEVNSFGRYSVEEVVLATINVVAREDGRWIEDEEQFRDHMEHVGITDEEGRVDLDTMKRLRSLVKERMPSRS